LCLWLTANIRIARARTLKMVPYTKILLALLVILETSQALPVSQKDEKIVEEEIAIPIDEAKEYKYELNRDHELQGSINGGQSGGFWIMEQIAQGAKPSGSVRRKRQSGLEAMPDHLQAPSDAKADEEPAVTVEPAPIVNEAYAKRLAGSAIYKALLLSGGKRQSVESLGGYGRKKRMSDDQDEIEEIPKPIQGPIDHAYAQMLAQSLNPEETLLLAETIKSRPKRQSLSFEEEINEIEQSASLEIKSWGETGLVKNQVPLADLAETIKRPKRQSLAFEEEAIMQQIFPVVDEINEIEQSASLQVKPKIKSWGETGLVKNQN